MRKRSSNDNTESKKIKQSNSTEDNKHIQQKISQSSIDLEEMLPEREKMSQSNQTAFEDSLGAALMRALERKDIRDSLSESFAEKCTLIFDEKIKKTEEKIAQVIEKTDEYDDRI